MTQRLATALLGAVLFAFSLIAAPLTAQAETTAADQVGACLSADNVWLLVVDEDTNVIANQCVGTPATGVDALTEAGVKLGYDANNFICSMNDHPAPCPATFNGQFWNYYQGTVGKDYAFSQVGANESKPAAGSVEAWCYNAAGEESCTPPTLAVVQDGAQATVGTGQALDLPVTGSDADSQDSLTASNNVGLLIIGIGAVAVVIGLAIWKLGSGRKKGDALGGR